MICTIAAVVSAAVTGTVATNSIMNSNYKSVARAHETAKEKDIRLNREEDDFTQSIVEAWNNEHFLFNKRKRIEDISSADTWRLVDKVLTEKQKKSQPLTDAEKLFLADLNNAKRVLGKKIEYGSVKVKDFKDVYAELGRCYVPQQTSKLNGVSDDKLAETIKEYVGDAQGKARGAKLQELMEGCSKRDRNKLRRYLIKNDPNGWANRYLAFMGAVDTLDEENGDLLVKNAQKMLKGHKEGYLKDKDVKDLRPNMSELKNKEVRSQIVNIYDRTNIKEIREMTVQETQNGVYTKDEQREIWEDKVKNANLYSAETRNYFAKNIAVTDKSIQLDLNRQYTDYAVDNKDTELLKSVAQGIEKYAVENRAAACEIVMEAAKTAGIKADVRQVVEEIVTRVIAEAANPAQNPAAKPADTLVSNNPFKPNNQAVTNPFAQASPAQTAKTNEAQTAPESENQPSQTAEEIAKVLAKGNFAELDKYLSSAPKNIKEQIYAMLQRSPLLFKLYVDAHKDGIFKNQDISENLKDEAAVWLINRTGSIASAEYISKKTFSKYYSDKAAKILNLPSAA